MNQTSDADPGKEPLKSNINKEIKFESEKDQIKIYEQFRDYIKHEDNSINYRTNWNITVQSFLIATLGFSLQKKLEVREKIIALPLDKFLVWDAIFEFNVILIFISMVGFVVSWVTLITVWSARHAQENIDQHIWPKVRELAIEANSIVSLLPSLRGGGLPGADAGGHIAPIILPKVFMFFWFFTGLILILSTIFDIRGIHWRLFLSRA